MNRKLCVLTLLILSFIIAPIVKAEESRQVVDFNGIKVFYQDGIPFSRVCYYDTNGALPLIPERDIIRNGFYPSELGYTYDNSYWLPLGDWRFDPHTFTNGVLARCVYLFDLYNHNIYSVSTDTTKVATGSSVTVTTGSSVSVLDVNNSCKQGYCPVCGHKLKKKIKKSHYHNCCCYSGKDWFIIDGKLVYSGRGFKR